MKKLLFFATFLYATNIHTLLDATKNIPDSKIDTLLIKEAKANKKSITYSTYPNITIFANATHYSSDVSLVPLDPIKSSELIKTNSSIPFSQNIQKIGFSLTFPVFVKEIFDNKKKLSELIKAKKINSYINDLKRKSEVILLVSKLNYLFDLKEALNQEISSIKKTLKATEVGVNVGRVPKFKLLRLKDKLNTLKINLSSINENIYSLTSSIYNLTNIKITKKIPFTSKDIKEGEFIYLKPLQYSLNAKKYEIKAKKDRFLPKLTLKADAYRAFAKAYNTDEQIAKNLASISLNIALDLSKKNSALIEKAKISSNIEALKIKSLTQKLQSEIEKINKSIKEIKKALLLQKNSISLKEELLKGAKVAFKLNRMSVDEYLRYEDDLALSKAKYSSLLANLNSLIAQKALIYGKNFKKVFK